MKNRINKYLKIISVLYCNYVREKAREGREKG